MKNIKLAIAYEGTHFFGWQKNGNERSVEGELEKTLKTLLKHPIQLQAASRTDRGVHAEEQIVNFFTHLELQPKEINAILCPDIRVLSSNVMPHSFHPTLDAKTKVYRYVIGTTRVQNPFKRRLSWHFPYITSLDVMRKAASKLIQTNDFAGFRNSSVDADLDTKCTISSIEIIENSEELHILITGDHFLYKMARTIAGTLAYIGAGKQHLSIIDEIFETKDRTLAGITAPAEGLFLERIYY